jgi:hypothetical protein
LRTLRVRVLNHAIFEVMELSPFNPLVFPI